ncbi:hypothetical protein [Phaeodactylibacter xiamenensis]|nr:hypothetical protein [Phaeodactylibacter xiamenensis]
MQNLGDAFKRMLDKHNQELRLSAEDIAEAKLRGKAKDEALLYTKPKD